MKNARGYRSGIWVIVRRDEYLLNREISLTTLRSIAVVVYFTELKNMHSRLSSIQLALDRVDDRIQIVGLFGDFVSPDMFYGRLCRESLIRRG